MSHPRERRPSMGQKTGKEKDELALYKCLTSEAGGVQAGGEENGEVNKYD